MITIFGLYFNWKIANAIKRMPPTGERSGRGLSDTHWPSAAPAKSAALPVMATVMSSAQGEMAYSPAPKPAQKPSKASTKPKKEGLFAGQNGAAISVCMFRHQVEVQKNAKATAFQIHLMAATASAQCNFYGAFKKFIGTDKEQDEKTSSFCQ